MAPAWVEVLVLAPLEWHELVAEALALSPCTSVAFGRPSLGSDEPPEGWDYVRTYYLESQDSEAFRGEVEAALRRLAEVVDDPQLAQMRMRFRRLPPEDYANSWRKSWKPMRVAPFAIVPRDWQGSLRASDVRLWLEPGGAFGTGRHPTTRGCLRAIGMRARAGERVLDVGCGSGVLAVAAALRGASFALGFDIDPTAIPYANELAEWNGVGSSCEFRAGGFECLRDEERDFDGVLANIYADVIEAHASELAASLRPGGWFAFSGCVVSKRAGVLAALERTGLRLEELRTRGRWDTFVGTRAR